MANKAEYAAKMRIGRASFNTANTARDGSGITAVLATATAQKGETSRIDRITLNATGTTTSGMLRLYVAKGIPGEKIASLTNVSTTVTCTTETPHNRKTGDRLILQGAYPDEFNVIDVPINVTSTLSFTYTATGVPSASPNPGDLGHYSTTPATAELTLWKEIQVSAITPSAIIQAWGAYMTSLAPLDQGYLPLFLPAGYSLRVSTHNAEAFVGTAQIGDTDA